MTQRNTPNTVDWYRHNEVWPGSIGFDPDGMCLKICRTARNIGAMFPTAVSAQAATPMAHRVHDVEKIKRGMVVYYDDPNDSNPFGHIVTVVGRREGVDRGSLASLLTRTNSVKSNQIVVAAGDYYPRFWGDKFQFAATWLNGQVLDLPEAKAPQPKPPLQKAPRLRAAIAELQKAITYHEKEGHDRLVRALRRDIREIRETIRRFD